MNRNKATILNQQSNAAFQFVLMVAFFVVMLFWAFAFTSQLRAAQPRFSSVQPFGGQRGTEVTITVSGRNLEDAKELMFHEPGIKVLSFTVDPKRKGRTITAKLKIDSKCRLGNHLAQIRTLTGLSESQIFSVGALPTVEEKEPNSDFQKPQKIAFNSTVHGRIDREDVDYYLIEVKKGQRITAEVEGIRLGTPYMGRAFFDPYVAIMNLARFELSASDDEALSFQDSIASMIAPKDDKYVVAIRDSSYNGGRQFLYRLHVGSFPRPMGVVPSGGKPGEKIRVKFLGDLKGTIEQEFTLPTGLNRRPVFGVSSSDKFGISPTWNPIRVSPLKNVLEIKPNNTRETATKFSGAVALNGCLEKPLEDDHFKTTLKKGQQIEIEVFARRLRSKMDSVIYIYTAAGKYITSDDDRRRPDSWLRFKAPADGDYVIMIRDQLRNGGPEYTYRIEVTPVQPRLHAETQEKIRYYQPSFVIPKGRHYAFLVNARKENFGGALKMISKNLPPGVSMIVPKTMTSDSVFPVMLRADKNAKPSGKIARFSVLRDDPKQSPLEAPLVQKHLRIRGRNQGNYVRIEKVDTIPVVVTDEIPFDVRIIQPKVPIIQGSSLKLKIVATRKKGFDAPIKITVLQNPSGVNSSRSISIPKGKSEAVISLNASGRASIRESEITVRAVARVGNGERQVFTPFVKIRVAKSYLTFKYKSAAAELGKETDLIVTINQSTPFSGKAEVKLYGLPARTSAEPIKITKDMKEASFRIKVEAKAKPGTTKNLFAYVTVIENGEPILHKLGYGRLRVNRPIPPKKKKPAKKPVKKPVVKKPVVKKPVVKKPKPLSRLEQLRLQQKEREQEASK